jgi:hypothetical protein
MCVRMTWLSARNLGLGALAAVVLTVPAMAQSDVGRRQLPGGEAA